MKVLIVARCKSGKYAPFITEQVDALERVGVECQYFGIGKNGLSGYFGHLKGLRRAIDEFKPDIIHAHYGLSGVFANLQRRVPVITTYHGSDINERRLLMVSKWAIGLSAFNIFTGKLIKYANGKRAGESEIPAQYADKVQELKEKLTEAVAESDDTLMEKYSARAHSPTRRSM